MLAATETILPPVPQVLALEFSRPLAVVLLSRLQSTSRQLLAPGNTPVPLVPTRSKVQADLGAATQSQTASAFSGMSPASFCVYQSQGSIIKLLNGS